MDPDEKNRKTLKGTQVSINSLEFFGLFLTIVGMVTAIFSPRMGHMEAAMSICGYAIIAVGILAILGGCTLSFMKENKKKDTQVEIERAFPTQISFQHGIQTITRRGSVGMPATLGCGPINLMGENKKMETRVEVEHAFPTQISFQHGVQTITRRGSAGTSASPEALIDESCHYNYEQVKLSPLSTDGLMRMLPISYPEEPPPSYYEVMRMAAISNN